MGDVSGPPSRPAIVGARSPALCTERRVPGWLDTPRCGALREES